MTVNTLVIDDNLTGRFALSLHNGDEFFLGSFRVKLKCAKFITNDTKYIVLELNGKEKRVLPECTTVIVSTRPEYGYSINIYILEPIKDKINPLIDMYVSIYGGLNVRPRYSSDNPRQIIRIV